MNDQDKRAVEGMARCGIDFEGLCASFPKFPREKIEKTFIVTRESIGEASGHGLKRFLQPLEDGLSSGRSCCAAGWVRGMRGKSLHFPITFHSSLYP